MEPWPRPLENQPNENITFLFQPAEVSLLGPDFGISYQD
jgi:hypothetical protein